MESIKDVPSEILFNHNVNMPFLSEEPIKRKDLRPIIERVISLNIMLNILTLIVGMIFSLIEDQGLWIIPFFIFYTIICSCIVHIQIDKILK